MLMQREQTSVPPSFPIPLRYQDLYFILWKMGSPRNVLSRLHSVCLMENRWQRRKSGNSKIGLKPYQVTLPSSNPCWISLEQSVLVEGEQDLYGMSFIDIATRIIDELDIGSKWEKGIRNYAQIFLFKHLCRWR